MIDLHSCAPCFNFFNLGRSTIFLGGVKWEWGLTLNPMEKFEHHILNSYNSKIIKDIDMASSDAYIECYGQYVMVH